MENISHEELKRILHYDPDTGVFTWAVPRPKIRIGRVAGTMHHKGYVNLEIRGKHYAAHRLAWFYVTGVWPAEQIDHVDRDRANNAFSNLRPATNGQNRANSRTTNKHGLKGVRHCKWLKEKPYLAQITYNKRAIYLGCYPTPEEAHEAYKRKAAELHGEFANP